MSIIKLENITKLYGKKDSRVVALDNISVEFNQGDMIAIMGTSGSGKSTLLNILGTIDEQTSGNLFINDKDIGSYGEKEKAFLRNKFYGFVMQDFALISHYNVRKNIMLPLQYVKMNRKENRVDEVLKKINLHNKKMSYPSELSGGQQQRIAIARALVNDAEVLLCDEPTGALDSKTTKEIMELFKKLNEEGKTIIIVTHDENVADYCKKTIVLEDGKIVK